MRRSCRDPRRFQARLSRTAQLSALLIALAGCTGTIAGGGETSDSGDGVRPGERAENAAASGAGDAIGGAGGSGSADDDPAAPGGSELDCNGTAVDPGPSPMRLLTREQYLNTVRDLFGDVPGLAEALGAASQASAFGLVQPDIGQVELESFQAGADRIAAAVTTDADRLAAIAPCAADADAGAALECARAMLAAFGARVYRSPLDGADDIERHLALFTAGAQTSYAHGIELLLRGMLQAPRFLYRVEIGSGDAASDGAVALSGHELAVRLSYLAWETLPDAELGAAADDGTLATPGGVAAQLARLLADERGASLVRRFLERLTHVQSLDAVVKDAEMYPEWQEPAFRDALRAQASGFFDHVLGEQGGRLGALLTSTAVLVNRELGPFYGVDGGDRFEPIERADGTAAGLLTLPALLARLAKPDQSSPIYRGKFVRETLLCQELPAPPANVPRPPEVEPGVSTRERLSQHEVDPACSGCHRMLDPIGFGFEHFDAIGRYRSEDGGEAVDARGELVATRDIDGAFDGVAALGEKLAGSAEVEECMVRQWFRFAIGRFEQDLDACAVQALVQAFRTADQDLNALPAAIAASDAFRYRRPVDAEAAP